jgi:hypothetical protein
MATNPSSSNLALKIRHPRLFQQAKICRLRAGWEIVYLPMAAAFAQAVQQSLVRAKGKLRREAVVVRLRAASWESVEVSSVIDLSLWPATATARQCFAHQLDG